MKSSKPIMILLIIVITTYVVMNFFVQQPAIDAKKEELKEAQNMTAQAKIENQRLKDEKAQIGSNKYIEQIARNRLGLLKKNEIMFIDVDK